MDQFSEVSIQISQPSTENPETEDFLQKLKSKNSRCSILFKTCDYIRKNCTIRKIVIGLLFVLLISIFGSFLYSILFSNSSKTGRESEHNHSNISNTTTSPFEESSSFPIDQFDSFDSIRSHPKYKLFSKNKCSSPSHDINRGRELSIKNFPFLVGIILKQYNDIKFGCIGSFIQPHLILIAAHCQFPENNFTIHEIYFYNPSIDNITNIKSGQFEYIRHPKFIFNQFEENYDLGLIKLKRPISKHLVCLPVNETKFPTDLVMVEFIDDGSIYRNKIKQVEASIVDANECKLQYQKEGIDLKFYETAIKNSEMRLRQIIFCASNGANYTNVGSSGSLAFAKNRNKFISYGTLSMGGSEGKHLTDVYMNNAAFIVWIMDSV